MVELYERVARLEERVNMLFWSVPVAVALIDIVMRLVWK
jgi:hypothetical protein